MLTWTLALLLLCGWRPGPLVKGSRWASPAEEALDERRDAEILRAVVTSVAEWERRHSQHRPKRSPNVVCYDDVGCFTDAGAFGYLDMLPSSPQEVGTRFLLYGGQQGAARAGDVPPLDLPAINMTTSEITFNSSLPTKVIVHGFGSSCSHVWVYEMRSALMSVEDCNVICVDWESGAAVPNYVRAAANTQLVGRQLAQLLRELNVSPQNTHLIGFSLGAHVAGFTGSELQNISRITGLDPAGPLFESQDPHARLDSGDAMFVDVIHSNGENLILGGLGSWQPMGDVDFYPNGGRMQKGCSNLFVGAVTDILWSSDIEGRSLCNHRRAYKFFTDSVSPHCHFPAFPCDSYDQFLGGGCFPCNGDRDCGNMGYYADRSHGRGTLYLITRDEEPFCAHQYHVKVESSHNPTATVSYGKIQLTLIGNSEINETFILTQKDDEELKVGEALSRIMVPHPVLQEPKKVQILYTAYSGWWSSGLNKWIIDKIILTDSFGKSLSICKKGLILESGTPSTLRLFPGDCNPPWYINVTSTIKQEKDDELSEYNSGNIKSGNITNFIPTKVLHIGDEIIKDSSNISPNLEKPLPWQPVDLMDTPLTNTNSLEDSRSFQGQESQMIINTTSNLNNTISKRSGNESALLELVTHRSEIKEPILLPTTTAKLQIWPRQFIETPTAWIMSGNDTASIPEIREPILNPKSNVNFITNTTPFSTELFITNATITPRPSVLKTRGIPADLMKSFTATENQTWMPSLNLKPPPLGISQGWQHWKLASVLLNNEARNRFQNSFILQLFPQHLSALLSQAERYTRFTAQNLPTLKASAQATRIFKSDGISNLSQRKPKLFSTIQPDTQLPLETNEKGVVLSKFQPRSDSNVHSQKFFERLVPYYYTYKNMNKESTGINDQIKFIPLTYSESTEVDKVSNIEKITVTPEEFKNFRTSKIYSSSHEDIQISENNFHPVYLKKTQR